jgi:hypothetical protein
MDTEKNTCGESRCHESESEVNDCRPETGGRLARRRWRSWVMPLAAVILLLLLGYYLDAEVIKWLGIIFAIILLLMLS